MTGSFCLVFIGYCPFLSPECWTTLFSFLAASVGIPHRGSAPLTPLPMPTPSSTPALLLRPPCCSCPSSLSSLYNHSPSIPLWVNQVPFSPPSLLRHTHSRPCLSRAGRKSTASPFILETNRRDISAALSWNVPGGDGIFRCQNSTSLCRACTNCKGSNAYTWSRLGCHLPNVLKSKFQLFG